MRTTSTASFLTMSLVAMEYKQLAFMKISGCALLRGGVVLWNIPLHAHRRTEFAGAIPLRANGFGHLADFFMRGADNENVATLAFRIRFRASFSPGLSHHLRPLL